MTSTIQQRIQAVRDKADIVAIVGAEVRLSRHSKPRGKCPFHGSKSDSFAVYPDGGNARCWGCGWHGDAITFVQDYYGLDFMGALVRLEGDMGLDSFSGPQAPGAGRPARLASGAGAPTAVRPCGPDGAGERRASLRTQKRAREWRPPETVPSAEVARYLWSIARPDPDALRTWLRARKVPEPMLADRWLAHLRFCESAPISAWPKNKGPDDVAHAPAMVALIRRIEEGPGGRVFKACGVHSTYLSPGLRAKMNRKRANGVPVPARKMYGGSAGGVVLLGEYRPGCALFVGEGIETVLSGMGLARAAADACGLAVLSLDNLQGRAKTWKGGILPLFAVEPDPDPSTGSGRAVCFAHDGPVTGLMDADMAPLKGPLDRETGKPRGLPVVERRGGPIVRRTITSAERTRICADLFVKAWRAAGCRRVTALRPHMGLDFNDAAMEAA